MMSFFRTIRLTLFFASLAVLSGCSADGLHNSEAVSTPASVITVHGRAMGGQQAVTGATVKLYKITTNGDGTASTSMLTTSGGSVTTDLSGNFSITSDYNCGTATDVFLVVSGGNPGSGVNANLTLMSALGLCSSLTSSTAVTVNELTTVAAVAALHLFMSSPTSISSSSYDASALQADFALAGQLVSTASGTSPGTNIPSGFSVNSTLINTLGNILAACINTTGTAGSSNNCASLFTLATPPGGTAPTDTVTALLNVVNHPTLNTTALFGLINSSASFQPALTSAPSTYSVALTPPASTITRSLLVEPDDGISTLYSLITNAQSSVDMTVYGLQDLTFTGDLVADCQRGVTVRVILDSSSNETNTNTAAYNQLNAQPHCSAVWSNSAYPSTHEKSFAVDNTQLAMLTLNVETRDYPLTRDFAVITNDPQDVAAFEATFNADYNMTFPYATTPGDDLIWSPTTAQTALVGIINNATTSLQVENEEMSATKIVNALAAACTRGVNVHVIMSNDGTYTTQFNTLKAAGCSVHTYVENSTTLYIHAKVILADYGTAAQLAYVGSINFSLTSMVSNRELGMYVYDSAILTRLNTTLVSDYSGGTAF